MNNQAEVEDDEDDCFLALPASRAAKVMFPPGSSVMVCSYDGKTATAKKAFLVSAVVQGKVVEVGVNLEEESKRETLYKIQVMENYCGEDGSDTNSDIGTTFLAQEDDIQFSIGAPVWLTLHPKAATATAAAAETQSAGVVIGAEHLPVFEDDEMQARYPSTIYSVQTITGNCKIHHGVMPQNLAYRHPRKVLSKSPDVKSKEPPSVKGVSSSMREEPKRAASLSTVQPQMTHKANAEGSKAAQKTTYSDVCDMRIPRRVSASTEKKSKPNASEEMPLENLVRYAASLPPSPPNTTAAAMKTKPAPVDDGNGKVFNPAPFVEFRWLQYGKNHNFTKALEDLREQKSNRVLDKIIYDSCLRWHLKGDCTNVHCSRAWDHRIISKERALAMEEALWPVTSETGPIFCRRIDPSEYDENDASGSGTGTGGDTATAVGHYKYGYYGRNNHTNEHATKEHRPSSSRGRSDMESSNDSSFPAAKRIKLQTHATANPPPTACEGAHMSIHMRLPVYFGVEQIVKAIMGDTGVAGQQLCNKFSCSITIGGTAISHTIATAAGCRTDNDYGDTRDQFVAELKGPSLKELLQCQLEIEQILYSSVHPTLRGYLLYVLGQLNSYRDSKDGIVETRNPYSFNDEEMVHICAVKAARNNAHDKGSIVRFQDAEQCWKDRLQHKYPQCRLEMVQETWGLADKIYPFILLVGNSYETVYQCRKEMKFCCCRQIR